VLKIAEEFTMKTLLTLMSSVVLLLAGTTLSTSALADHGKHHMMGGYYGGHSGNKHWKSTLTDEQRTKLRALKLKKKKKVIPLKLKIKQAKVDLAMLIGSNNPGQSAVDKKISAIIKLKQQKMQIKAKHKIAVRKLLNDDQKVMFDLHLLKKAKKGKHCRRGK
jgi:Spy/CpxP family protein refolding chaperone